MGAALGHAAGLLTVLAHQRTGTGARPLVLLHGLLGSARNLATLARGLAARRDDLDVVAFDLTGHGASPPLPPAPDTATLAADVLTSADTLGLGRPLLLVGHSLGGRVGLRAAAVDPARISGVTLLDIGPGPLDAGDGTEHVLAALLRAPDTFAGRGEARAALVAAGLAPALADWLVLNLEAAGDRYRWSARGPVARGRGPARVGAALRSGRRLAVREQARCATARGRGVSGGDDRGRRAFPARRAAPGGPRRGGGGPRLKVPQVIADLTRSTASGCRAAAAAALQAPGNVVVAWRNASCCARPPC